MNYIAFYKHYRRIVIAVISLLILGVVVGVTFYLTTEYGSVGPNEKIYYHTNRHHRPMLNPNPQYYLTIVVTGDAELIKRLQLHFLMQYGAMDIGCSESVPWTFGTAGFSPYINVMQWARKQQKLPYVFVFALDRYQGGMCDWRVSGLLSSDASTGGKKPEKEARNMVGFKYDNPMPLQSEAGGTLICDKQLNCFVSEDFTYFNARNDMPLGNYRYFLNIIKKQEN